MAISPQTPRRQRPALQQVPWTTNPKIQLKSWTYDDILPEFGLTGPQWAAADAQVYQSAVPCLTTIAES